MPSVGNCPELSLLAGSSLSDCAEPIFSLWNDADWRYTSNAYFLETGWSCLSFRPW